MRRFNSYLYLFFYEFATEQIWSYLIILFLILYSSSLTATLLFIIVFFNGLATRYEESRAVSTET